MGRNVWVPVVSGPLAPYAAGFESWLVSRAYSPKAAANRLYQFDQLSRWLERVGLGVGELTGEQAERFVAARRAAGLVTWAAPQSAMLPLGYLRLLGVVPAPMAVIAQGPLELLLEDYRRYLRVERALCDHTVLDAYEPAARLFLAGWEGPDGLGLERLSAAEVSSFLARECPQRSVSGARDLICALRSFLRYLHLAGVIEAPLVWAVPSVADLRDRSLPRGLELAAVERLLASCDRRTLVGRRDYAVLLLSRLGLRAGEVAAIGLDDIDWRAGLLLVHGKGSRQDVLPLPVDVGEALVSYLRRRPRCECRALFLRVMAPRDRLNRCTVAWVARAACDRAGLPRVGAHRPRHTAATEMLRAGASLAEIGQVLRHREQKTTAVYAKVDRKALRSLARPWLAAGRCGMTTLSEALADYLRIRRRLGFVMPPGRPAAGRVRLLPRTGRRRADHDRASADVGADAGRRASAPLAPAALRRSRVRPVSRDDRPRQRGSLHRPFARASPTGRAIRLHRRGDHGADQRRMPAHATVARRTPRDHDRVAGRHRNASRRGARARPPRRRSPPRRGARPRGQAEEAARGPAQRHHDQRAF